MPRVTRRSLASKKEEEVAPPAKAGKRGSKKAEPVEEPEPIGEPAPSKTARSSGKGKGAEAKEEPPKGRAPSRGRGKKQEEPEEEIEEKEIPAPKRGRGRGKKDDQEEKIEEAPAVKRPARGGRGKKEEVPEEDEEEELPPPPKKQARGGRGKKEEEEAPKRAVSRGGRAKKEEPENSEVAEAPTPEKTAPKGRGRSARGSKSAQPEEVDEEKEAEEEEASPRGRQNKTPTSGGRRGRGKKEEVSSPTVSPTRSKRESATAKEEEDKETADDQSVGKDQDEPPQLEKEKPEEPPKDDSEKMDAEEQDEQMEIETEAKAEVNTPATVEEQKIEAEVQKGKKRKLEDEDNEMLSSPKKARVSESSSQETLADKKDEDANIVSDFVVVNKEDLPAADSKEVEAALPPPVEEEEQAPEEMEADDTPAASPPSNTDVIEPLKMAAPSTVVPLTEAELAKQYNPTIRDRDDNSSMMVEIGSEAASDVGSISRNLDVSEMGALDQPGGDDSIASSDVSETTSSSSKQTESTAAPLVSNEIPLPPPASAQTTPVVEMASIPLPSEKSSAVPPPVTTTPVQSSDPVAAPTPVTAPPAVQLNSIPMPPNYNSNSSSDLPSVTPAVTATQPAQNGACKPSEQVAQSPPIHTSTPAKKPISLDSSYVPSSPSITQRKFISNRSFPIELMDPAFCFSVVSYNILADCHLRRYNYSYTEAQYLELTYRHSLFLKELDYLDGDIVCMQEVDTKYYSDVLLPSMTSRGYQGMFKKRTQDWYDEGEATFVRTSKFEVLSYEGMSLKDLAYEEIEAAGLTGDVSRAAKKYLDRADVVLVCKLLSKRTGKHLTVGNIHVAFDPKAPDVQCIQVASAVKELVSKAGSDLNPYIICGDFNSETTSPAYQLAKDGYLTDEHIRVLQNIQSMDNTEGTSRSIIHYLWKAFQHTSSNMKSAYETTVGREPVITSLNSLMKACLDYIFYSSSTLYTVGAMEVIDPQVIEATGGLPSKEIPSDHLSVKAVFRLKD